MNIPERLASLRRLMAQEKISYYLIPTSDYHDSEYVGDYFRAREYMSGFTGSAGTLLVTPTEARLWTDGRYFLQAAAQLEGSTIILMKSGEEGVPTISAFIEDNIEAGETIGFDGRVWPVMNGRRFAQIASDAGGYINYSVDLVSSIWEMRPELSANPVITLPMDITGSDTADKLASIREIMQEHKCNYHILTSLDDIAWILNMRGSDVECNPVFLSYLIISMDNCILFANESVFKEHSSYLEANNIILKPYNDIYTFVNTMKSGESILIDEKKLNYSLYSELNDKHELVNASNPSTHMKALKNITEQNNLRKANITDGVAMVRFLHWLDENIGKTKITELSAAAKLQELRNEGADIKGLSFDTIAGYNAHGAIIHYEPTEESDVEVQPEGLFLVDSGAQYLTGTTDITRTIAVGPLTEEMKHDYTKVLRAHLNLEAAVFKEGCCGANLDILARAPFWDEYEDYNHGTGHGVGFFLNVHEGPQSFHWNPARPACLTPLEEGMVITDEPGIYIEGKYGIRIENDILCHKSIKNEYGQFMNFEALTLCPIDTRPVNVSEMNAKEKSILNSYHKKVYDTLSPLLNDSDRTWLAKATEAI